MKRKNILVSSFDKWLVIGDEKESAGECLSFVLINRKKYNLSKPLCHSLMTEKRNNMKYN